MRILVDYDSREANGYCENVAPEAFRGGDPAASPLASAPAMASALATEEDS